MKAGTAALTSEENNIYWDAQEAGWPVTGTNRNGEDITFVDATRTVATYNATLGGAATLEAFIEECLKQSKDNWRTEYTALAVNWYLRTGYAEEGGEIEPPPIETGGNVLANDTDADGDELTVAMVNGSSALVGQQIALSLGSVVIHGDGEWVYTLTKPRNTVAVTEEVTYRCTDGIDPSNETTLTITVSAEVVANNPPVANPDQGGL